MDDEWGAETVDVLAGVVPVGPVRADLVADGDFVGEGGVLRDGAEGREGSATCTDPEVKLHEPLSDADCTVVV